MKGTWWRGVVGQASGTLRRQRWSLGFKSTFKEGPVPSCLFRVMEAGGNGILLQQQGNCIFFIATVIKHSTDGPGGETPPLHDGQSAMLPGANKNRSTCSKHFGNYCWI